MQDIEITELIEELKGLTEDELCCGLGILASGYKADWIKNIQCEVVPKIKKSSPASLYLTEESKQVCRDTVSMITNQDKAIRKKALENLKTNPTKKYYLEPGKLFFEELREKFKGSISGIDTPQETLQKKLLKKEDISLAITKDILAKNALAPVYIPLLVYFALLISRTR